MLSLKRVPKNMPSDQSKLRFFSVVSVALALGFTVYSYGVVSTSLKRIERVTFGDHNVHEKIIKSSIGNLNLPLRSIGEEEIIVDSANKANYDPLVPPYKASEGERIAWLMRNLPSLEIFKPDSQFHSRVLHFFDSRCEARVFMTWISPAKAFGSREFLALESLFKSHPKGCLMILSRTLDTAQGYEILKPLIDRRFKVHAVTPDLSFLVKDTPAEAWLRDLKRGNRDPGEISLAQNLSNLMRLAVLNKYGGIYLDTDFIVMKPLTGLRNSIGAQSINVDSKNWTRLNNAVLIFDMNHPLLLKFIEEFALTFDGNKWGHNGPYLVSRVVQRVGQEGTHFNFTVLPPMAFYPVDWTRIGGLFQRPKSEAQSKWVKAKLVQLSGETFGIHLWNKQSSKLVIEEGSVMGRLISDHCVICKGIYTS